MYGTLLVVGALWLAPSHNMDQTAGKEPLAHHSYTTAWHAARDAKLPMLVILNPPTSENGAAAIDGEHLQANKDLAPILDDYVVAVIDTGTEHGKKVNELFGSQPLPRIVVIDKEQKKQIFKTSESLSETRLASVLKQYRDGVVQPVSIPFSTPYIPADCPSCRRQFQGF